MNKLLVALIAGGFAIVAAAQTTAPATKSEMNKEKAKTVDAATAKGGENSTGGPETAAQAKKTTAESKNVAKPTTSQKKADAVSTTTKGGESSTGGPETAAQGKANTAKSKEVSKPTAEQRKADEKAAASPKNATP